MDNLSQYDDSGPDWLDLSSLSEDDQKWYRIGYDAGYGDGYDGISWDQAVGRKLQNLAYQLGLHEGFIDGVEAAL